MKFTAPRGTKDLLPDEIARWQFAEAAARSVAERFGYQEIRTPIFEATDLFARGVGGTTDIVEKEMYTFTDRGDRSMSLRPEGTAGIVRAYLEHNVAPQSLAKLWSLGPMFRYNRPGAGRYRQFYQFGVEAIGSQDPALDAEIIALAIEWYKTLGLSKISVKVNTIGCEVCRPAYADALRAFFQPKVERLCEDCRRRLDRNPLRILDCKVPSCQAEAQTRFQKDLEAGISSMLDYLQNQKHPVCGCLAHFEALKEYLTRLSYLYEVDPDIGRGLDYEVDLGIVRGLDYYTKTVFEVVSGALSPGQNALCGGGRYDRLVEELGGKPTPAVGFAAGIERALIVLEEEGVSVQAAKPLEVFVVAVDASVYPRAWTIAMTLRQVKKGFRVDLDFAIGAVGMAPPGVLGEWRQEIRTLKAQMKHAARIGARCVVIVGLDELAIDEVMLKNLATGKQDPVREDELVEKIRTMLEVEVT